MKFAPLLATVLTTITLALSANPKIDALESHLQTEWQTYKQTQNPHFDTDKLTLAITYATEKHHGQTRNDAERTPYIIHPLQVCNNLWEIGEVRNANILIAALLHDTLEDTSATADEINTLFGPRVLATVQEVTNDPNLTSSQNKQLQIDHVPLMSQDARLVKLSDRLTNITDLSTSPPTWPPEKVTTYYTWGQKLLTALKGTNSPLEAALQQKIDSKTS